MTPQEFLDEFGTLAESADGVPKLREFVLRLAVQGKLVKQDPNDEPAEELIEQGKGYFTELVQQKRMKKPKPLPPIADIEHPFQLPPQWAWCRLGEIARISSGKALPSHKMAKGGQIPVYGGNGVTGHHDDHNVEERTLVIGRVGFYCGSVHITPALAWITDNAFHTTFSPDHFDLEFLYWLFKATDLRKNDNATAQPVISGGKVYPTVMAVPPLAEQHRIVAKVDELMRLCDGLEAVQQQRRGVRLRLNRSSLDRLTSVSSQAEVSAAWQRVCDHFQVLYDTPETLPDLRQTILQLAVQGKLVKQDPNDEPADRLIESVKNTRIKSSGGQKRALKQEDIDSDKMPFSLPTGWRWVRLQDICLFENGDRSKNYPSGADIKTAGVPFISTKAIHEYHVRLDGVDFITDEKFESLRSGKLQDEDILVVLRGSVGKLGMFRATNEYATGFINAQLVIVRSECPGIAHWLLEYFKSPVFLRLALARSSGSAQPQLSASELGRTLVALPPLSEQKRIVSKVTDLLSQVTRLESTLTRREATRTQLLTAAIQSILDSHENGE